VNEAPAWFGESAPRALSPFLRTFVLAAASVLLALLLLGVVLVRRGEAALTRSDEAFHGGHLQVAIAEAKQSALAYVPGSEHVLGATERLEAIARGAEADGRRDLARLAWDALRVVDEQTAYPGRGPTASGALARQALLRLRDKAKVAK
jgi:hypothetical protein